MHVSLESVILIGCQQSQGTPISYFISLSNTVAMTAPVICDNVKTIYWKTEEKLDITLKFMVVA